MNDATDGGLAGFERMLDETRQALAELRGGDRAAEGPDAEETRGEGQAAGGQLTVTAGAGGRLEAVRIDPRALRMGVEALGEQLVIAANAALEAVRAQVGERAGAAFDPDALTDRLQELQNQSVRQMYLFSQGIADSVDRIQRAAGSPPGDGAS
jgi:DNA-binding protein YbaB